MHVDNFADDNSCHDQYVAEHRERKEQMREENRKRGTLRRRVLLLDLSSSKTGHHRPTREQEGGENTSGIEECVGGVF